MLFDIAIPNNDPVLAAAVKKAVKAIGEVIAVAAKAPVEAKSDAKLPAFDKDWKTPDGHLSDKGRAAIAKAYADGATDDQIASAFDISKTAARRNRDRYTSGKLSLAPRKAELVREVIGFYKGTAGWSEDQQKKSAIDTVVANTKMSRGMARKYVHENWPKVA